MTENVVISHMHAYNYKEDIVGKKKICIKEGLLAAWDLSQCERLKAILIIAKLMK